MTTRLARPSRFSKAVCRNCRVSYSTSARILPDTDKSVNSFISYVSKSDLEVPASPGVLSGVPIAIKDNICTENLPTTCASDMLKDFNAKYDATVVGLLKQAGARIIGKTNCDAFGMGSLNLQSAFGPVINPFQSSTDSKPWTEREQRSAGGSSGGSAAAVASKQASAALGTDTGGSIRLPASYCGVVGFKPSYGLLSRWGVVSYADSLDTVGIIASNVQDTKAVFDVVSQYDSKDPTSIPPEFRDEAATLCSDAIGNAISRTSGSLSGLRIGIPQEYFPTELDPSLITSLRRVLEKMKSMGATLVPVSLPSTLYALSAYYVLASAEASSNMARYDGVTYGTYVPPSMYVNKNKTADVYAYTRSAGFGREVRKRILMGTYALTADAFDNYYLQAQKLRNLVRADFNKVFRVPNVLDAISEIRAETSFYDIHVLLHLSAIRTAPPLEEAASQSLEAYVQDTLTVPASLAGLPAMSIPAGLGVDGWPLGVSVVGQWGCDEMVLRVGEVIEQGQSE
ncbi:hypothetical protein M422DRAFT_199712 [Sphaerobolus stellatus SS14]|nr:hypothetical protein M422DRAFT_199712 [Sphaerobolus stellatus SS14]